MLWRKGERHIGRFSDGCGPKTLVVVVVVHNKIMKQEIQKFFNTLD